MRDPEFLVSHIGRLDFGRRMVGCAVLGALTWGAVALGIRLSSGTSCGRHFPHIAGFARAMVRSPWLFF